MAKHKVGKSKVIDISKKIGAVAFLLLASIGIVISTFFASVTTFDQTNQIIVNEAASVMTNNDIVLAQLQNKRDGENTQINPYDWPMFVKTFNKTLGYDSSSFKCFDNGFIAMTEDNVFNQHVVISDITTNFSNPLHSSNNIVFLTGENMRHFGDQSIIIDKESADAIINASTTDDYSAYADLYDYHIIVQNNDYTDTYYVSGVYNGEREANRNDFGGLFNEMGKTFFVSTNAAMKYGPGKLFVTFTNNHSINKTIFEYLRKILVDHHLFIQFPDCELNNIEIDGTLLPSLRSRIVDEYTSPFNILLALLMWIITISLIIIIIYVFDDVQKIISSMLSFKHKGGFSLFLSFTLLVSFLLIGAVIQTLFFKYYYFNGFIVDFLFPASATSLLIVSLVLAFLSLSTSYRSIIYSKVKSLVFPNVDDFVHPFADAITKKEPPSLSKTFDRNTLIIGGLALPSESAGANRIKASVRIFNEGGMKCHVLGYYAGDVGKSVTYEPGYEIIPYHDLRNSGIIGKIKAFMLPGRTIRRIVLNLAKNLEHIDLIYIYSALPIDAILFLRKFTSKNGIRLVYDVVEFQLFTQQNLKSLFTYFLSNQVINRLLINKDSKVIAISSFLESYFAKKDTKSFIMPYVNDTKRLCYVEDNSIFKKTDKRIFMYAGNPFGRRDLIAEMVKGFLMLDEKVQDSIVVVFAGISAVQCLSEALTYEEIEKASKFMMFLGKIPHENVRKLYKVADYSILLKPEKKRFSHAGFPTKIAESWGYGIPVVTNFSSDLKNYLIDGYNGFVSRSSSPLDFKDAILRAAIVEEKQLLKMRKNSRTTSEKKLDYHQYKDKLLSYLGLKNRME